MTLDELCRCLRACEVMQKAKERTKHEYSSSDNIHNLRDADNTLHNRESVRSSEEIAPE